MAGTPANKNGQNTGPDDDKPATIAALSERLDDLGVRIDVKTGQKLRELKQRSRSTSRGIGQAMRLSSEFIAAIFAGAGIGYLVDLLAGTSPWALIVFLLLGFAAGVLNVLRVAGLIAESNLHLRAGNSEPHEK